MNILHFDYEKNHLEAREVQYHQIDQYLRPLPMWNRYMHIYLCEMHKCDEKLKASVLLNLLVKIVFPSWNMHLGFVSLVSLFGAQ